MHNPRLKHWLHRIDLPTLLLWGEQDGIVTPAYGERWRKLFPGRRMESFLMRAIIRIGSSRTRSCARHGSQECERRALSDP